MACSERSQKRFRVAAVLLASVSLAACATVQTAPTRAPPTAAKGPAEPRAQGGYKVGKPYQVNGVWYTPREEPDYDEVGIASWYGDAFQFRPTASGEPFDMYLPSAAHKTLPLQSIVEVTNLENGRSMRVRINDRGPFVQGRIIDLSRAAADELGMVRSGVARVRVRFVGVSPSVQPPPVMVASAPPRPAPRPAAPPIERREAATLPVVQTAQAQTIVPAAPPPAVLPRDDVDQALTQLFEPAPILASAPVASAFEVQAGAFSDRANAERVRQRLAGAGEVVIRPLERETGVLYRVVVSRLGDETAAAAVRDEVAGLGFPDAKVIRGF